MSFEDFTSVIAPKVNGAWNLHHCLSKTELDFFVMLSSSAGIVGSRGQAAYAGSSTVLGAFAHWRNAQGLPADTIHLGAVSEVGFISENQERKAQFAATYGDQLLTVKEFFGFVQAAIEGQVAKTANHECVTSLKLTAENVGLYWVADAQFAHCRRAATVNQLVESSEASVVSIAHSLNRARTKAEATKVFYNSIAAKFCATLMIPKPVVGYGLKSLIAVEVRNWFARELDAKVQLLELTTGSSLNALADLALGRSALVNQELLKDVEDKIS